MTNDPLERLGEARRHELSETGATVNEFTRPLDPQERDAVLDAAFARVDAAPTIVPLQPRGRRWGAFAAGAGLLAAALVAWFAVRGPTTPATGQFPAYALTRRDGGQSDVRSDPTHTAAKLRRDDAIDWTITPEIPMRAAFDVALVADLGGAHPQVARITDAIGRSEDGAVRLRGPLSRFIDLEPGVWTIAVVVAPIGGMPERADIATIRAGLPAKWQAVELDVTIVASSP